MTRDLSIGGLSFVSEEHFQRGDPLGVTILGPDNKDKHLIGKVVYSRYARDGWCLTGMRFGPVDDERLAVVAQVGPTVRTTATRRTPPCQAEPADKKDDIQQLVGKRERALAMLAAAGASHVMSKETINKVVTLSMSPDRVVRRATIPVLLQIPRRGATLVLVQMLNDPNPSVQIDAADALGQLRVAEARAPLKELLRHSDHRVALRAAEALGNLGSKDGLRLVARLVRSDEPINRRAARALGVILGQPFRPNNEGVATARRYLKAKRIK